VTLILDSGGVSALASDRARLLELRRRGHLPAQLPTVVLTEVLTGDPRRDFAANRLLRLCQVRDVTEPMAREAARLRTATRRASKISATDAVVVAFASASIDPVVLTSDVRDLSALAEHAVGSVTVVGV
jgi:predicted nucleic acid-binding protein